MSTGEKYFWGTILFFLIPFTVVTGIAMFNTSRHSHEEIPRHPIIEIRERELFAENLEKAEPVVRQDLLKREAEANATVDEAVERIFAPVYARVESFLDYHYSIVGEYAELGHAAVDNIDVIVRKRLFGDDFERRFRMELSTVGKRFEKLLEGHGKVIGEAAVKGVDLSLNRTVYEAVEKDVARNITMTAATFVGVVGGAKLAARVVPKLTAKFLAKVGTKLAAKVSAKTAAKTAGKVAAAEAGAASGVLCGPFVWICSPVLATAAWFATDAVVIKADEMLTRETFEKEIVAAIDEEKTAVKKELKERLSERLRRFSREIRERYEKQPVKVKEMIYGRSNPSQ
ncbi:hypothetical protein [Hydrogenimonas sp.]